MQNVFYFGDCAFDNLIKADSLSITPNARQDIDSYRDANGLLHRTALSHTATIIEFDTIPMWESKWNDLMADLVSNYLIYEERDAMCSYYDSESCTMKTGHFYLDSNFQTKVKQQWGNMKLYDSNHFKFVEY